MGSTIPHNSLRLPIYEQKCSKTGDKTGGPKTGKNDPKRPDIYKCVPGGRVDFGAMKSSRAFFWVMKFFDAISGALKSFSHLQWLIGKFLGH